MGHYPISFRAMGSPCELQLYAATAGQAEVAAQRALADIELLEARYSRYRDTSLLSHINRVAAQGGALDLDEETAALLDYADTCYQRSDGLFDISSGLLRRAWNFAAARLPDPAEIHAILPRVGWDKLIWRRPRLEFPVPGMELDLGGLVKEYAADRAAGLLLAAGIEGGLVNLGGDIRVLGPHPDGRPWRIGIRHPRTADAWLAEVQLHRGAIATSGDYQRCLLIDGRRYGHLLDPRTGWPVAGLASVSLLAPSCLVAGSAASIALLKGAAGPAWLAELGLPHLWMGDDGTTGGDWPDQRAGSGQPTR